MARFNRRSKTPEAALARAIAAIGEPQDVAVELNPIKWKSEPDAGGRWVSHCADPDRREKFSLREVQHIFRRACETGDHSGFEAFAELCGYNATATVPEALLAEALKRADSAKREAEETARDLQSLIDNPRLLAAMRAAHVNTDVLA
jgi:hypothetical protein